VLKYDGNGNQRLSASGREYGVIVGTFALWNRRALSISDALHRGRASAIRAAQFMSRSKAVFTLGLIDAN